MEIEGSDPTSRNWSLRSYMKVVLALHEAMFGGWILMGTLANLAKSCEVCEQKRLCILRNGPSGHGLAFT